MKSDEIGIRNPFGTLRRAIVGIIDGATVPELHQSLIATMPKKHLSFFRDNGGKPFPKEYVDAAREELDNLVRVLEERGAVVDRPSSVDFSKPIITPYWSTSGGLYAAMPRDILLVARDKIIVAPMSWRSRYREIEAYYGLLESYKDIGYEIVIAPRPQLKDDLYRSCDVLKTDKFSSILTEREPVFDAADFVVLDRVILVQESHATNAAGINWLKNQLGNEFEVCILEFNDTCRMHIDATFVPLREGLVLVNPERVDCEEIRGQLPGKLKSWLFVAAQEPVVENHTPPKFMSSDWLSMNVFTLDSYTVIVEEAQLPLIRQLESYGFDVIRLPFKNFQCFGGSFHCATQEIIRDER